MEGAWLCVEDESGQGLSPPKGRTWGRRGHTPVVKVTGAHNTRISLAALICVKPGHRLRLITACTTANSGARASPRPATPSCWTPPTGNSAARWWSCGTTWADRTGQPGDSSGPGWYSKRLTW
jgi:hypothetical protein